MGKLRKFLVLILQKEKEFRQALHVNFHVKRFQLNFVRFTLTISTSQIRVYKKFGVEFCAPRGGVGKSNLVGLRREINEDNSRGVEPIRIRFTSGGNNSGNGAIMLSDGAS